jgi:hypothetical protein
MGSHRPAIYHGRRKDRPRPRPEKQRARQLANTQLGRPQAHQRGTGERRRRQAMMRLERRASLLVVEEAWESEKAATCLQNAWTFTVLGAIGIVVILWLGGATIPTTNSITATLGGACTGGPPGSVFWPACSFQGTPAAHSSTIGEGEKLLEHLNGKVSSTRGPQGGRRRSSGLNDARLWHPGPASTAFCAQCCTRSGGSSYWDVRALDSARNPCCP